MDVWSNSLIEKFDNTCDPKERWTIYKQMTKKHTDHSVLPLIDSNSNIAFDNLEKCSVLQSVFFESNPNNVNFDNDFRQEVENEVNLLPILNFSCKR